MHTEDEERAQIRFGMASVVLLVTLALAIAATRVPHGSSRSTATPAPISRVSGASPLPGPPGDTAGSANRPQEGVERTPSSRWRAPADAKAGSIAAELADRPQCPTLTNGCQLCWRTGAADVGCSTPGIACQPGGWRCGEP